MTSADFTHDIRLRVRSLGGGTEDKILICTSFGKSDKPQITVYHPAMARFFSTIAFNGRALPTVMTDFGQDVETFHLVCTTPQDYTPQARAQYLMSLRNWIKRHRMTETDIFYLQVFVGATSPTDATEKVWMDPMGTPILMGSGDGFRGCVTAGPEWSAWNAGDGATTFTLDFTVGLVLP
jgi:hypothetical protein